MTENIKALVSAVTILGAIFVGGECAKAAGASPETVVLVAGMLALLATMLCGMLFFSGEKERRV
jgi:hypothetical protein